LKVIKTAITTDIQKAHLGLYVHVPFCASTCDFCAFYQEKPKAQDIALYLKGVEQELQSYPDINRARTVLFGGGTPGMLSATDLEKLGSLILNSIKTPPLEWTIELAPASVRKDKLKVLKQLGVNRISMGVQTFSPPLLDALGRKHSLQQIHQAYGWIQEAGFENVNLDLIFAIPGQSLEAYHADIKAAAALKPTHLSTYCLTFEEDTVFFLKLAKGIHKIDREQEALLYQSSWELLESYGYHQYEISNFTQPGYACHHNINTWNMHEWIGIGPAAASQYRHRRYTNVPSLELWLKGLDTQTSTHQEEVILNETILAADALMFGLRMNAGVDLAVLKQRYPSVSLTCLEPLWQLLEQNGQLSHSDSRIYLTPAGRLVADAIATEILCYF
jgi:oxygen-independent coproporphyrinogen-3 oxidase